MALTAKKVYAILKRQISDMEAKLNSPVRYRGTVATADLLPLNPDIGDMYNIESKSVYGEAGMNVAWNGVVWDTMGAPIDMSLYIKSNELADWVKQQNKPTYTAEEVGALPADTKIPSKTSDLQNDSGFLTKIPDNYLSGTDKTLSASGKAADAKTTGDKFTEMSADISKKLDKNQGVENSGKIAGINESGDIVPMFPVGVEYNEKTNCLEFGSDQKMKLNQGIGLDNSLTKAGYAADAGVVGEVTNSLKEDLSNKITKFYASNQGETHITDSDNGKIQDMMIYGKSSQDGTPTPDNPVEIKSVVNPTVKVVGKNLLNPTLQTTTKNGVTCTANGDGTYTLNGTASKLIDMDISANFHIENGKTYRMTGWHKNASGGFIYLINGNDDVRETGNGITFTYSGATTDSKVIHFQISANTVLNVTIKPMICTDTSATYDDFEPYHEQTVTLPYTLNAIPVSSGGNVTIDGQQYIADYVDVERGKLVKRVYEYVFSGEEYWNAATDGARFISIDHNIMTSLKDKRCLCSCLIANTLEETRKGENYISTQAFNNTYRVWISPNVVTSKLVGEKIFLTLTVPEEIPLTQEEIRAFKELAIYYPVTNVNITSEQLDGYTVFNYPVSMENGWNYVKQQLNDNRDYIYDMDLQSAEAYVNSEYAVTLTELEV